jgi:serine acetyltransferase
MNATDVDWSDPAPGRPIPLVAALRDDLRAHVPPAGQGGPWPRRFLRGLRIAVTSSGFHVALHYRLAHTLRHRLGPPGRALAGLLFWWGRHAYDCSIAPTARIHGGLILPHPQGLVVGAGAEVGPRAWIFQNVTLGGAPEKVGLPRVGADARIFAGAVLSGPVTVGDNVVIGANAVVYRDVPSRSIVRVAAVEVLPLPDRFVVAMPDDLKEPISPTPDPASPPTPVEP